MSKEITLEEVRKGDRIRMAREITVGRDPVLLGGGTVRADDGKLWVTYGATIELLDRPISIPTVKGAIVRPRTIRVSESGNHYIQDEAGNLIIAAPGWLWIEIDDNAKGWTF